MLRLDVFFEADRFIVERRSIQATDKAGVLQYQLFLLFFATQIGKGVDDDTKNQIQYDNDDDEEEQQIVDDTCDEQGFL